MDASWIESYGYWAVLLGGLLEGEGAFLFAGWGASQGHIHPLPTFLLAMAAGSAADSTYYWLGRAHGPKLVRLFPSLRRERARAVLVLRRWGSVAAFFLRFAYGLRIGLSISMGAARLRFPVFLVFNLLGSALFAGLYLTLGYVFGEAVWEVFSRIPVREGLLALAVAGAGWLAWRAWRRSPAGLGVEMGD